ncbi:MAG: glycosyltransferase family 2 protein [Rhodospirillales bacterium]|jgi:glycosyltransferase involved in cell wall biosynthesis|nr:glycosyltransferase family 2 protein [Rhodospirillales bacterium]
MDANARGLSYIVPAYNEEDAVVETLEKLNNVLSRLDVPSEIILVNDGSLDGTLELAKRCSDVRIISHPVNTGYGSALKTGILAARYPWIGIVDADGTYDIEQTPSLVEKMEGGFDMAVAARKNIYEIDRPVKRFFRRLMLSFLNLIIAAKIEDPNSGFRIFTKELAIKFFPFLCNSFSFTTSLTVFALGEAYFVCYVPVEYSHRAGKSKVRHFRDTLRMVQLIIQGVTFTNPVKFFLILAVCLVLFVGLPAMALALAGWDILAHYYLAVGVAAVFLVGLGVIGDIVRISTDNTFGRKAMVGEGSSSTGTESGQKRKSHRGGKPASRGRTPQQHGG